MLKQQVDHQKQLEEAKRAKDEELSKVKQEASNEKSKMKGAAEFQTERIKSLERQVERLENRGLYDYLR